jgi:hypothetical protein
MPKDESPENRMFQEIYRKQSAQTGRANQESQRSDERHGRFSIGNDAYIRQPAQARERTLAVRNRADEPNRAKMEPGKVSRKKK